MSALLKKHDVFGAVDGILLDLGVSSPQLADPGRGFSFQVDGPLDMRMDPARGESAGDWINSAAEKAISNVLFQYGEENSARKIARAICERRAQQPIKTTLELAQLIESVVPHRPGRKHPATKSFQAIRIYINQEIEELNKGLSQALDALRVGGRLCVIRRNQLDVSLELLAERRLLVPPPGSYGRITHPRPNMERPWLPMRLIHRAATQQFEP